MCPDITPDFSEAAGVVPGTYTARIVGAEIKLTKATPPQKRVSWKLEVFGETAGAANGGILFHSTMAEGRGAGMLRDLVLAATGEELKTGVAFNPEHLTGKEIVVVVVQGTDQSGAVSKWPEVTSVSAIASAAGLTLGPAAQAA